MEDSARRRKPERSSSPSLACGRSHSSSPSGCVGAWNVLGVLVAQWICGLRGHCVELVFEPHCLRLRCVLCGFLTDGWEVGRPQARPVRSASTNSRSMTTRPTIRG